jgi:hypothetical protein
MREVALEISSHKLQQTMVAEAEEEIQI